MALSSDIRFRFYGIQISLLLDAKFFLFQYIIATIHYDQFLYLNFLGISVVMKLCVGLVESLHSEECSILPFKACA